MSETLTIRPFRPADAPACARIYVEARRVAFSWCPPDMFTDDEFARDSRGEAVFVAEEAGEVRGFLSIWTPDHFIHLLFVDPAMHRRGIGAALLRHAERQFGSWGWLKCQSGNLNALAFYTRMGWTVGEGGVNELGPWRAVSWLSPDLSEPARRALEGRPRAD
ncbi:GNAT family N-acetyltransferase [Alsobacter sp. SYSU M60028]|uniref:GNAT family N-acetyltransferase n=1 Tax=Alsobacter ponti TaxID=2962936 RepID=A0ABT1LLA3_9HYPH|nr:GNAT family N-acetyltransferase [Alsobacter ponti]MCP8941028.1 GNAT family N-acetyltransferase [Alsobacter ponti]